VNELHHRIIIVVECNLMRNWISSCVSCH